MSLDVFQMRMAMGKKQGLSGSGSGSLVAAASSSYTAQRLQQQKVQQGALCPTPPPLTAPTRPMPTVSPMLQSHTELSDAAGSPIDGGHHSPTKLSPTKVSPKKLSPARLRGTVSAPDLGATQLGRVSIERSPPLPPLPRVTVALGNDITYMTDMPGHGTGTGAGTGVGVPATIIEDEVTVLSPRPLGLRRRTDHDALVGSSADACGGAADPHGWYMKVFPSRNPSGRREAELLARYLDTVDEAAGLHAGRAGAPAGRRKGAQADSSGGLSALRAGVGTEEGEAEDEGEAAEGGGGGGGGGDGRDGAEQGGKGGELELLQGGSSTDLLQGAELRVGGGAPHAAEVRRVVMARHTRVAPPPSTTTLLPRHSDPHLHLDPEQVRRVMTRYEVVFDELVRQVATHCLERGHCLARVWSQLSMACSAFEAHEELQQQRLRRLQAQLRSATQQLAKQGLDKAALIMQKAVLEGRLQWGKALSRITRYKDTVRLAHAARANPNLDPNPISPTTDPDH